MTSPTIDFTPLSREPATADLQAFRAAIARGDYGKAAKEAPTGNTVGKATGWLIGGFLGLIFAGMTLVAAIRGDRENALIGLGFLAGCVALGLVVGFFASAADRRDERRNARLDAFATANGFEFRPVSKTPELPGVLKRGPHTSTYRQMRWDAGGAPAQLALYHRSSGGSQPNSTQCRYLAVHLGVPMPALTFTCGRRGPFPLQKRGGPDAFEGVKHSLRADRFTPVDGATTVFDERVVALLTDRQHPCNAQYLDGWFIAFYDTGVADDESLWRHALALAEAVAATKPALVSKD